MLISLSRFFFLNGYCNFVNMTFYLQYSENKICVNLNMN